MQPCIDRLSFALVNSNVRVLAEARLGADSQEPLVGLHVSYVTI